MKFSRLFKNKTLVITLAVCSAVLLTAGIIAGILLSGRSVPVMSEKQTTGVESEQEAFGFIDPGKVEIIPLVSDSAGVHPDSGFRILCEEDYSESVIRKSLSVAPEQEYKLEKLSSKEFLLKFDEQLESDSIYRFSVTGNEPAQLYSWAFQTQKTFKVLRTLPRDKGTSVPVNTGIEITFNYENVEKIEDYFEISPEVPGRFEHHKKTVVFIPERLEHDTIYTVTVKKGLGFKDSEETLKDDYVFQFQTEPLRDKQPKVLFSFADTLYNITSKDAPVLEVYASKSLKDSKASVEVYKYPDEKAFLDNLRKNDGLPSWAYIDISRIKFDTSKLQKVLSFETQIVTGGDGLDWNYPHYIILPNPLPEGHYLISSTISGINTQSHMQINDASVYITVLKNKTLAWINDSITGNPVEGAFVEFLDTQPASESLDAQSAAESFDKQTAAESSGTKTSGSTAIRSSTSGIDGIAVINGELPLPSNGRHLYFAIGTGQNPVFIARLNMNMSYRHYDFDTYIDYNNEHIYNYYWTYLYTDRGVYLPTDTVNIWGIAKPRDDAEVIKEAELQLVSSSYYYSDNRENSAIVSQRVKLDHLGTFEGKLDFSNLSTGYYRVDLVYGDSVVAFKHIEVREYSKPAYRIDIQPSKKEIFLGESITFDVQASFYEGTPVSGLKLKFHCNMSPQNEGTLVCDENGKASFTLTPYVDTDLWHPQYLFVWLNNSESEEQDVYAECTARVFTKDTMAEISAEKRGDKAHVEILSSLVDFSGADHDERYYYNPENYRGSPVSIPLEAVVTEEHWEKAEIGTYYDYVNKTTYKKYDYYRVFNTVKSVSFTTDDAGKFSFDFPVEKDKAYRITVMGFDTKNSRFVEDQYYYFGSYYDPYSLRREHQLVSSRETDSYKLGEKIDLNITSNLESPTESPKAKYLYLTMHNGLMDYNILDGTSYSFEFVQEYIPNIYVQAIVFDGTNIFDAGIRNLRYDAREKQLTIGIKPDKPSYRPGDTVNLDIEVKDADNVPCRAAVNLSLVDESFFAVQEQYVDTLAGLYSYNLPAGIISYYLSYTPIYPNLRNISPEEGGEGGDQPAIRSKFKDTAFFGSVETDAKGKAHVSFRLPDNLTSWRITYQGITADMKAGSGKLNISASLPFFTDIIFNNVFMAGDSPYLTVRSYGTALVDADSVSGNYVDYKVELEDEKGVKKVFSAKAPPYGFAGIGLGKLEIGKYSVTVTARYGDFSDGIKKDFRVVDTILEASRLKSYKLSEGIRIQGGESITALTFSNSSSSFIYNALSSLMYTWGERVDQKLSRKMSRELMSRYYGDTQPWLVYQDEEFDLGKYQTYDGGIALFGYSDSDPEISAKICSVAKDSFDTNALKQYFYRILDNKDSPLEDMAASYWGLAALGEPVLIDIKNLAKSPETGLKEKLCLAVALSEIGDFPSAQAIYSDIIKKYGKTVEPYMLIDAQGTRDDTIELTALCSAVAMKLNATEKYRLYNYVKDNAKKDIITNFEELMMVTNSIPESQPECSFTYQLDGTTKDVVLEKNNIYQLVLTAEEVERIKFSNIKGDISVTAAYSGPVKDLMEGPNNMVRLKRVYSVDGVEKTSFSRSDLIKVTVYPQFEENAPDGFYEITDVLPAGLRYVQGDPFDYRKWYPEEVSGQKVVFGYYYGKYDPYFSKKERQITYYARAVCPGEYTADNALVKHCDSETTGFTETQLIKISN